MFRVLLSPRMIGVHLLALAATAAAAWLGLWQYGAWQAHRESQALNLVNAPAKPLEAVLGHDDPFPAAGVGQPVDLRGAWVPTGTFYVSDKPLDGRTGYWVVTPVAVCGNDCSATARTAPAVLVVRGWTPSPQQAPAPPTGQVAVRGWLQPGEGSSTPDPNPRDDVLPALRIADAVQRVDQDLYSAYVMAKVPREAGLAPLTPAVLPEPETFTALRNILYALEWWVFAGFAVFIWWRWVKDEVTAATGGPPDDEGSGDAPEEEPPTGRSSASAPEVPSSA